MFDLIKLKKNMMFEASISVCVYRYMSVGRKGPILYLSGKVYTYDVFTIYIEYVSYTHISPTTFHFEAELKRWMPVEK
mgnify:CR=1 FL=1